MRQGEARPSASHRALLAILFMVTRQENARQLPLEQLPYTAALRQKPAGKAGQVLSIRHIETQGTQRFNAPRAKPGKKAGSRILWRAAHGRRKFTGRVSQKRNPRPAGECPIIPAGGPPKNSCKRSLSGKRRALTWTAAPCRHIAGRGFYMCMAELPRQSKPAPTKPVLLCRLPAPCRPLF